jgi:DnaJ like chaperone protein
MIFPSRTPVDSFQQATGGHRALNQTLLMFLWPGACRHELHAAEREALLRIGPLLGFTPPAVENCCAWPRPRAISSTTAARRARRRPTLEDAYAALGVSADASDAEVKRAYRR